MIIIILVELTVDPAVAERGIDGLSLGDAGDARARLGELDPETSRVIRLRVEPALEDSGIAKGEDRQASALFDFRFRQRPSPNSNDARFSLVQRDHLVADVTGLNTAVMARVMNMTKIVGNFLSS